MPLAVQRIETTWQMVAQQTESRISDACEAIRTQPELQGHRSNQQTAAREFRQAGHR
jgi:hypothetical protein